MTSLYMIFSLQINVFSNTLMFFKKKKQNKKKLKPTVVFDSGENFEAF